MRQHTVILDFDGTLTDEVEQAKELSTIAKRMLAEDILTIAVEKIEELYKEMQKEILDFPHRYFWEVNGLRATYAYEGAYLLNTSILQHIMMSQKEYINRIKKLFPSNALDSVTRCSNHLFHKGSMLVQPHFLPGVRDFLIWLIEHESIEPMILSNSETKKIRKNLEKIKIGEAGTGHSFPYEIEILGDTRQYHMDAKWDQHFDHAQFGSIQILPIDDRFSVDLRRPIYHAALAKVLDKKPEKVTVVADGFSLAGALPLMMGIHFILFETPQTPEWCKTWVSRHDMGMVASTIDELRLLVDSF